MADLFLGVDTGGTAMKYVVLRQSGSAEPASVCEGEVPTDPQDPARALGGVAQAVAQRLPDGLAGLAGVGLACAGIVDPVAGRLGRSPNLPGWQDSDLGAAVRGALGDVPLALANDVNGALYGEFRAGAGSGCRNLVMLALGTGVGGGIILDGRLLLGTHFGAAEIGHMVLDPAGPPCTCGSRGCLEAWAGSVGLLRAAREAAAGSASPALAGAVSDLGGALTTKDLADLAANGDESSREIFAAAGRRLGQAVGNLINLLDPERIIIGGGVARAGELILGPCRAAYPEMVLAAEARSTPVVTAELGAAAAAVGAARLALEKVRGG
jgi:glucokinase